MAEAVVQTHKLTKIYHHPFFVWRVRARALTDLDLRIERGEIHGLLGPNGSGKSTTIKILLGLLFPTRGAAAVFGKRPTSVTIKSRIGFLPEESYLYRFLDAEETLDFYGRLFGLPAAERRRRADALLELTGIHRERKRAVTEFSKGMQRRLGIASCLINDPELVVLDEPTSGLDPLGTRQVKDIILELKRKGKTVLLSSHLLADVEDVCDKVTILYGGRMRAEGEIKTLLADSSQSQIVAEMTEDDARAAADFLRKRLGPDKLVRIQPPTERLEDFFLRIVREAQEKRVVTSGADGQGSAAGLEFLSQAAASGDDEAAPERLLQNLTRGEETAKPAVAAEKKAEAVGDPALTVRMHDGGAAVADSLLSALTSGEREEQAATEAAKTAEAAEPQAVEDRSVLDRLTRGNE